MKRISYRSVVLSAVVFGALSLSACSKDVTHDFGKFPQQNEPTPTPTVTATPTSTPTPSPTPSTQPSTQPSPHPTPIACTPGLLDFIRGFSAFAYGKLEAKGTDFTTKIAAKSEISLDDVSVGSALSRDAQREDLSVRDYLELRDTVVSKGKAVYGNKATVRGSSAFGGIVKQSKMIDFDAVQGELKRLSNGWAKVVPNGETRFVCGGNPSQQDPGQNPGQQDPGQQNPGQQNPGQQNPGQQNPGQQNPGSSGKCVLTFHGELAGLNVFVVDTAKIERADTIVFDIPTAATAMVNVAGSALKMKSTRIELKPGVDADHVLWNGSALQSGDVRSVVAFAGTVVAPSASISVDDSAIYGSTFGTCLRGDCSRWQVEPFDGCLPRVP